MSRQNFWKVSSSSEHHSKPTMNINSQHHNLLGNQISPKSEDFCICGDHFVPWLPWQRPPFWNFSTPQKLPHTTVDIPTKFHEVWWKESKNCLNPPFFVFMATAAKFVQPIPIVLAYAGCECCSFSSFINFCWASNLLWSFLCFSILYHFGRFHGNGGHFENSESSLHIYSLCLTFLWSFISIQ